VEPAPGDRREARVPVPLPGIVARARTGVCVADAPPLALGPARPQHPLAAAGEVGAHSSVTRYIWRSDRAPRKATRPASATRPGQVPPQLRPPMNPCLAASVTWVTGLIWATVCRQPVR